MSKKTIKDILNTGLESGIKTSQLALICSQYRIILSAGVPLPRCTSIIESQLDKGRLKDILRRACSLLRSGTGISEAFERSGGGKLPVNFIETIRAGEKAGSPAEAFGALADYYARSSQTSKKVKTALIYPAFVLLVAIGVLAVVMIYVMPKLTSMFDSMDGEIPGITKVLMAASDFMAGNILQILGVLALLVLVIALACQTRRGAELRDRLRLRLPVPGKVLGKSCQADFAGNLALLLRSGLPLTSALGVTSRVLGNTVYKRACISLRRKVEAGRSLGAELPAEGCFDKVLCDMTAIGEETGDLAGLLDYCSRYYRAEADAASARLLAMLEPALLIGCSAFAAFIAFAIYIPLFDMYELF